MPKSSTTIDGTKPFGEYKWQFASVQPTESLLQPAIYFGVLRALAQFEGRSKDDADVRDALATVALHAGTRLNLRRTGARNLLRNSGQYWTALGLLEETPGVIELTQLGRDVASGAISRSEFVALAINSFELPNARLLNQEKMQPWVEANVRIRPFVAILRTLLSLRELGSEGSGYLSVRELTDIVVPLSGQMYSPEVQAEQILRFRAGEPVGWPDPEPGANDERMANEFLRFLAYNDVLGSNEDESRRRATWHYELSADSIDSITALLSVERQPLSSSGLHNLQSRGSPLFVDRSIAFSRRYTRPNQRQFRTSVLGACKGRCVVTGEAVSNVLHAAHIIPVENRGADDPTNGVCLRMDVHSLFDAGLIRIRADGAVFMAESLSESPSYGNLPESVALPESVDRAALEWRWNYL